jgi:hypothetical protein
MLLIQKRRNAEGATTRDAALSAMMAEVSPRLVLAHKVPIDNPSVGGWVGLWVPGKGARQPLGREGDPSREVSHLFRINADPTVRR